MCVCVCAVQYWEKKTVRSSRLSADSSQVWLHGAPPTYLLRLGERASGEASIDRPVLACGRRRKSCVCVAMMSYLIRPPQRCLGDDFRLGYVCVCLYVCVCVSSWDGFFCTLVNRRLVH